MNSHRSNLFRKFIVTLLLLMGCTVPLKSNETASVGLSTSSLATPSSSPLPSFTATFFPPIELASTLTPIPSQRISVLSPTPIPISPTLSSDEESLMVEALHSKDCELPCYLGITPGKTRLNQAKAILESFGGTARYAPYTRKDGAIDYSYSLKVGDPAVVYANSDLEKMKLEIGQYIHLISTGEEVQSVEVELSANTSMAKFQKYWEQYVPQKIFLQYGSPDQIYAGVDFPDIDDSGYTLFLVYEKLGVVIHIYGTKQGAEICPLFEGKEGVAVSLSLYDTQSPFSKKMEAEEITSISNLLSPIDKKLGIDKILFYKGVLQNPKACFLPQIPSK